MKAPKGEEAEAHSTPAFLTPEFSGCAKLSQAPFLTSIPLYQALRGHICPVKPHGNFCSSQPGVCKLLVEAGEEWKYCLLWSAMLLRLSGSWSLLHSPLSALGLLSYTTHFSVTPLRKGVFSVSLGEGQCWLATMLQGHVEYFGKCWVAWNCIHKCTVDIKSPLNVKDLLVSKCGEPAA